MLATDSLESKCIKLLITAIIVGVHKTCKISVLMFRCSACFWIKPECCLGELSLVVKN